MCSLPLRPARCGICPVGNGFFSLTEVCDYELTLVDSFIAVLFWRPTSLGLSLVWLCTFRPRRSTADYHHHYASDRSILTANQEVVSLNSKPEYAQMLACGPTTPAVAVRRQGNSGT